MKKLKTVLQETSNRRFKAGGQMSHEVLGALQAHRRNRFRIFLVLFALLTVAVSLSLFFVAQNGFDVRGLAALSGALGLSVGAAVELMRRVGHEWSQADLLLVLLDDASEAQVTSLVDKLIERL